MFQVFMWAYCTSEALATLMYLVIMENGDVSLWFLPFVRTQTENSLLKTILSKNSSQSEI